MRATMFLRPEPRQQISATETYVPGKRLLAGITAIHELSSNELPIVPSPKAIEAFQGTASEWSGLALYADGPAAALREAIGSRFGLERLPIICGNGLGFLECSICIPVARGTPVITTEFKKTTRVDDNASARTKIVYVASQKNLSGTYISFSKVNQLHEALSADCLFVIDAT